MQKLDRVPQRGTISHEIQQRKSTVTMKVNEHFERLSLTILNLGLGVQDDFCIQLNEYCNKALSFPIGL
uniref:Uncharacterized protein n=1 Tax=Candidatus Kentrum sp. FM TaxID=2126340 RepID=A0A450SW96_9GAMM|nr:MAG: hypothetical protein BECKFM1743C_GA0114222_102212 [Candidatus Kentron sp. FM]VFJ73577.1 MAG: hypothetical protein BECKFM1743A_GA0114220_107312 [Candidatus Kentron sp. FM]